LEEFSPPPPAINPYFTSVFPFFSLFSVVLWTNELVNIWSHLLGAVLMTVLWVNHLSGSSADPWVDLVIWTLFFLSTMVREWWTGGVDLELDFEGCG